MSIYSPAVNSICCFATRYLPWAVDMFCVAKREVWNTFYLIPYDNNRASRKDAEIQEELK